MVSALPKTMAPKVTKEPSASVETPVTAGCHEEITRDAQVYASFPDGALWQSRVDGAERVQLTFPPVAAAFPRCSCPDHSIRRVKCKHIHAVEYTISRQTAPDGTTTVSTTLSTTISASCIPLLPVLSFLHLDSIRFDSF